MYVTFQSQSLRIGSRKAFFFFCKPLRLTLQIVFVAGETESGRRWLQPVLSVFWLSLNFAFAVSVGLDLHVTGGWSSFRPVMKNVFCLPFFCFS